MRKRGRKEEVREREREWEREREGEWERERERGDDNKAIQTIDTNKQTINVLKHNVLLIFLFIFFYKSMINHILDKYSSRSSRTEREITQDLNN